MTILRSLAVTACIMVTSPALAQSPPVTGDAKESELPWFEPGTALRVPPPPPPPATPTRSVVSLDVRATQVIIPDGDRGGGFTLDAEAHAGFAWGGIVLGYSNLAGESGLVAGLTFLRYVSGVSLTSSSSGWALSLALPDVNVMIHAYPEAIGFFPDALVGVSTDVAALRLAKCLGFGTLHLEARGPTLGVEAAFGVMSDPLAAIRLGAMIEGGFTWGGAQERRDAR